MRWDEPETDRLRARIQRLERALVEARHYAHAQTQAAELAKESASRAWKVALRGMPPRREDESR